MNARELMTTPPVTCHVNDDLNVVAQRMWDRDIGMLAVVNDEGRLTGVITDRDVCMAAYTQGQPLGAILVNSAMATNLATARETASAAELEQLMAKHQVRRIPIVDGEGVPVGIVSLTDLATGNAPKAGSTFAAISKPRRGKSTQKAA